MRVTTCLTKLTCEGKAILEKEISVNCPNIDRIFNNPLKANQFARDFLGTNLITVLKRKRPFKNGWNTVI